MPKRLFVAVCVWLLLVPGFRAESPQGKEKWTASDVVNAETAHDFQLAPDGRWVVWAKAAPDEDRGERVEHLFRSSRTGKEVQLTRGPEPCVHARWWPDGKYLDFLSTR